MSDNSLRGVEFKGKRIAGLGMGISMILCFAGIGFSRIPHAIVWTAVGVFDVSALYIIIALLRLHIWKKYIAVIVAYILLIGFVTTMGEIITLL